MRSDLPVVLFLAFAAFCGSTSAHAQSATVGSGIFQGTNIFGPANTSTSSGSCSRYAYIYPASLLSALKHGDTITGIEFFSSGGTALTGTINMKIYMRTTLNGNYGTGNINWVNRAGATGMQKVYDKNPDSDIGTVSGFRLFKFSTPCIYDTILGRNLEILVEYTQSSAQSTDFTWSYDNSANVPAYTVNQVKYYRGTGTLPDTTNTSNDRHPYIRLNFPRHDNDLSITKVYSLGKLPVLLGNPDSLRAIVKNVGKKAVSSAKIYVISKGSNKLIDSAYTGTLNPLQEVLMTLPPMDVSSKGLDTLEVRVAQDDNSNNNRGTSYRIATENIYSYRDPTLPPDPGGIGFNGSTGDFVAKFYSNQLKAINQITVNFGITGNQFRLGIWTADSVTGLPKTNIWASDTLISKPTFITPVYPPVFVNGSFFVGVRQINNNNVAFGYQTEEPVRPKTFFYASPFGSSSWVDFAPDAPFKFLIEPRLQAANDVAPFSYDYPKDTINYMTMKTMAPKATIYNYGSNDQKTPFSITCNIKQFNILEYTSTRTDTISSGQKHKIVFDSTFLPTGPGDYQVEIITKLGNDQVKDNDTLKTNIFVARYRDAGANSIFDPGYGNTYEMNVDTITPIFRINNFGVDQLSPFLVRANIYDDKKNVVYTDLKLTPTLNGISSTLMNLTAFPCSKTGTYTFEVYTALNGDKDRKNDTARSVFYIVKSNDVGVTAINVPAANSSLAPGGSPVNPKITIENLGDENQGTPFTVQCDIYKGSTKVYSDSLKTTCFVTIPVTASFAKAFSPNVKGYYQIVAYTKLETDQFHKNDTFRQSFAVGVPDDVSPVSLAYPSDSSKLEVKTTYAPKVNVSNFGFLPQNNPFDIHFEIRESGNLVYSSTRSLTIDSGKSTTITFDSTFKPLKLADHDLLVYTTLGTDFVKNNDTLRGLYHIVKSHDIVVKSISFPDSINMNTEAAAPAALIENAGLVAENTPFPIKCTISNPQGNIIYSVSTDSTIGFDTTKLIIFTQPFTGTAPGTYRLKVVSALDTDQENDNDTLEKTFEVVNRNDVAPLVMIYPAHSSSIKNNIGIIAPKGRIYNWGISHQADVRVSIRIRNSALATVYTDTVHVALNPLQTLDITFDSSFNTSNPGSYFVTLAGSIPNDQRPGNDSIVTAFTITDNEDIGMINADQRVLLYPNPASEQLTVQTLDPQWLITAVYATDMTGKRILLQTAESNRVNCAVHTLPAGLYTVEVMLNSGQISRQRVNIIR